MKRLYLLGTTADGKRLVLARSSGAKGGSFVVPITSKMRKILRDIDEGAAPGRPEPGNGATSGDQDEPPATAAEAAAGRGGNSFERMTGLEGRAASRRGSSGAAGAKASPGRRGKAASAEPPPPQPDPEPPKPADRRPRINSKLAPAQIQALLRQGKSAKSVAKTAGAPLDWVRRLMEPILQERIGIVEEMKRATFTKARLGPSVAPVGDSIVVNLRERGVPFPERTAAQGWTAHRPDGREWRVRFTFEHRGANRTAQWQFDPPTRSVVPLNTLATQLSWRGTEAPPDGAAPDAPRRAPARTRTARKPAAARRTVRRTAKRAPAKGTARGSASKRSSAGGTKRAATRKPSAGRSRSRAS